MTRQCSFTRPNGERCRGRARNGDTMCPFHTSDPATADRQREGRRRGGRTSRRQPAVLSPGEPDIPLASAADVRRLLARCINLTLRGQLDTKVANSAGHLAGLLVKSLEVDELAARVEALEEAARRHQANGHLGGRL